MLPGIKARKIRTLKKMRLRGKEKHQPRSGCACLLNVLPAGPTKWVPPKARELLGREAATVHGGTWEASEKKPEGSAAEDV